MKRGIFFLHNPKAGGSSLRAMFCELFRDNSVAPTFSNAPGEARSFGTSLEAFAGYDFYAGHYGYDVYEKLGSDHALITNFRNPVDRVLSIYKYWRNNVDLKDLEKIDSRDRDIVKYAKDFTFSEFIRLDDEDLKLYLRNFHCRQLAYSGWVMDEINAVHVDVVKNRIAEMPWFYVAETPLASRELLRKFLDSDVMPSIDRINVSRGPAYEINGADIEYLMRTNALDFDIYAFSLRAQEDRLRSLRLCLQ